MNLPNNRFHVCFLSTCINVHITHTATTVPFYSSCCLYTVTRFTWSHYAVSLGFGHVLRYDTVSKHCVITSPTLSEPPQPVMLEVPTKAPSHEFQNIPHASSQPRTMTGIPAPRSAAADSALSIHSACESRV